MNSLLLLAILQPQEALVVTGSREPIAQTEAPANVTTIDERTLDALDLPHAADALRLLPGASVSVSGPRGSQTQLRLRGAEANHTLLFVDGIRFNDPAAGNEARFELLNTDLLSSIELVPGPQSALWGPEALGGVISVESPAPFGGDRFAAVTEYGGGDSARASAQAAVDAGDFGVSGSASWLRSEGIDSLGAAGGDRDGFGSRSLGLQAEWRVSPDARLGLTGVYVAGASEYDGLDPATFRRADTADETANRIGAVRGWGTVERGGWTATADLSLLDSANRNRLGERRLNRTAGRRTAASAQLSRRLSGHRLTAAVEREAEDFRARDQLYFGGTDQDRSRTLTAVVVEWHARWSRALTSNLAVRHDSFSAFADATTVRAAAMARVAPRWTLLASYGEGIAQPTFYDLYGFFPGSFVGNPALRPERSRGWEAGIVWRSGPATLRAAAYANRLRSEIVDVFDPATFISSTRNVAGASRRRGIELTATYDRSDAFHLYANYNFLDAGERREPADALIREVRRPRHSANVTAFGRAGRLNWNATAAYVGGRFDTDFDLFPAARVRLDPYVLATARLGWRLTHALEAYARVENALGADYQDVVGYNTPGRTVYAGLRLRLGD